MNAYVCDLSYKCPGFVEDNLSKTDKQNILER